MQSKAARFFPLAVGNIWYFSNYDASQQIDTTRFDEKWEILEKKALGVRQFFLIQQTGYHSDGTLSWQSSIYYGISNDTLLQILSGSPFVDSSICVRAVFADSGYISFEANWGNDHIAGYLSARTDSTFTYQYWQPGWMDSGWEETYKIDVGMFDSNSGWGLGSRLVRYNFQNHNGG